MALNTVTNTQNRVGNICLMILDDNILEEDGDITYCAFLPLFL